MRLLELSPPARARIFYRVRVEWEKDTSQLLMDWTTPLRSLQADFIARLHSDAAVLHHLTNPLLKGYFSEMTIVSGAELAQVRQNCWSVADRLKHLSGQPIYDVFISHFYATMGEFVARKYLDGLVVNVDKSGLGSDRLMVVKTKPLIFGIWKQGLYG